MQSAIIAERVPATQWQLYLVRTATGSLYAGISTDPARRLRQHQGELRGGARALRGKGPLSLVWTFPADNRSQASVMELQLKQLKKSDKEKLVQGLWLPDWLVTRPAQGPGVAEAVSTEVA